MATLTDACFDGSFKKVKILIESGDDPNESEAFMTAIYKGYTRIVKYLLKHGARDPGAMRHAITYGHLDIVKILIKHGHCLFSDIVIHIYNAVCGGHLHIIKYLEKKYVSIFPILHWSIYRGHVNLTKYLVNTGKNKIGKSDIEYSIIYGRYDILKYFVQKGVNIQKAIKQMIGLYNIDEIKLRYLMDIFDVDLRDIIFETSDVDIINLCLPKIMLQEYDYNDVSDLYKLLDTKYKDHHLFGTIKKIIEQRQLSSQRLLNCRMYHDIIVDFND